MKPFKFELQAESLDELKKKILEHSKILNQDNAHMKDVPTFVEPMPPTVTKYFEEPIKETIFFPPVVQEAVAFVPPPPVITSSNRTVGIDIDKHGTPYDEKLHSSSRTMNKDGSWKAKKVFGTPKVIEPITPDVPVKTGPPYENITIPDAVRPVHSLVTFKNNLTLILAQLINQGKINQEYIEQLKAYFQVKDIWNVTGNEKQSIEMFDTFCAAGLIAKAGYSETNN